MIVPLFFGLLALLGAIYIWIGNCAAKEQQTNEDYFLMGRKLTFFPLSLTLLATQLGGGTLMGTAQEAFHKGWMVIFFPLGTCLGLFVLGMGFGGKLRKLNISTMAEIFEKVYHSRSQRTIASTLSIIAMFCILVAQGIAARTFFVALGADQPLIFIIFWSVLIGYTVMGGLKAVVNTDILQALFILATLCLAFFSANFPTESTTNVAFSAGWSDVPWTGWLFMPLLFMLIEQDMGQRCFAAKNPSVIPLSTVMAGIVLLASSSIAIYFGVQARELAIPADGNTSILIESVKVGTNPTVATCFMVGIFMAVISTADSLLCSISSNLSYDFLKQKTVSEKKKVNLSRALTLICGLGSLACSYLFDNVVTVLMISYELSVCILFIPITAAVLSNKPSRLGATLAMAFGAFGFLLFRLIDLPFPKELLTVSLSGVGYCLGQQIKLLRRCPS